MKKINALLGVAGVNALEPEKAKKIGRFFEFLVLIALLVVFVQILSFYSGTFIDSNWMTNLIWLVFLTELVVNLYNVQNKKRYLVENWLNVLIVLAAFPAYDWGSDWVFIVRFLRLLLVVRFFSGFIKDVLTVLTKNRFGQILIASAFIILGSGAIFSYIEDRSLWDGIWYSLVTITTVGYGDVVPLSDSGRVFGVVLILFGVVFFSLVTANISAFLIGTEQRKLEKDILEYMKLTEKRLVYQQESNEKSVEKILVHMNNEVTNLKIELKEMQKENLKLLKQIHAKRHN
ncbi:MAG TPA: Ion transport protein [Thiomicrospira sp.]|nr:Ion transport protein [Thiomicrospira sp.]